jgi:hypothetical protein
MPAALERPSSQNIIGHPSVAFQPISLDPGFFAAFRFHGAITLNGKLAVAARLCVSVTRRWTR